MLSTTIVDVCARCGREKIRQNGHANNGAPRARCLEGEHTFILQPKGARYDASLQGTSAQSAYQNVSGMPSTS